MTDAYGAYEPLV